jgi:hypothetical protein
MKKSYTLIIVIGFCLFSQFQCSFAGSAMEKGVKEPMTRAIYGFSSKNERFEGRGLPEMVEILQSLGVNAVFLKDEPKELITTFQQAGIRCYREIALFVGCGTWEKHPETRPLTADGTPLEQVGWYCGLNPTVEWLRQEKLQEVRQIVAEIPVDGIWLDFIRWPTRWELPEPVSLQTGFSRPTLEKFSSAAGIELPLEQPSSEIAQQLLDQHEDRWYRWRVEQITSFVQQVHDIIRQERPGLTLGLFGLPWLRGERGDAIYRIAGQDIAALANYVDVLSPMVYHRVCGKPVEWVADITRGFHELAAKPIWPIVQCWSEPSELTEEDFRETIRQGELAPSSGIILFSLKHLVKEKRLELIKAIWGKGK